MATKIYNYGALTPTEGLQNILDQLLLAHRYRNALVSVELDRREAIQAKRRELFPDLEDIEARIQAIDDEIQAERDLINQERIRTRRRVTATPTSPRIRELRDERLPLYAELRATNARINGTRDRDQEAILNAGRRRTVTQERVWLTPPDPVWAEASATINADANARRKALNTCDEFHSSKLSWGTKGRINETVDLKDPDPPKFRSWRDNGCTGRIAVQIQSPNRLTTADVFGDDTRVRLTPVDWTRKPRQRKSVLSLRIGSNGQEPVWAKVPVLLHRPMPEGEIKWVWLMRRKVGTTYRWFVQFTVVEPDQQHEGRGTVGIDDGFRKLPDDYPSGEGVRVAAWADDRGNTGECVLPIKMVKRWDEVKKLQGERMDAFNAIKEKLVHFLSSTEDVPEWFRTALATLADWRSQARLMEFIGDAKQPARPRPSVELWEDGEPPTWRGNRFQGDDEIFDLCHRWAAQERIDYNHERHLERHLENWRNKFFEKTIKTQLAHYELAKIENTNRAELARTPPPEEADDISKHYRKVASPGKFCELLKRYLPVKKVEAAYTTATCHQCGEVTEFNRSEREHTCECGATWDQDFNAAHNIREAV